MSNELKPCPFCGGPGYLCQIPSASGGDRYIWIAKCSAEEGCGVENFLAWFGSRAEWERENRNAKPVTRQDVIAMRDALRASDYVAEDARAKMEELND